MVGALVAVVAAGEAVDADKRGGGGREQQSPTKSSKLLRLRLRDQAALELVCERAAARLTVRWEHLDEGSGGDKEED